MHVTGVQRCSQIARVVVVSALCGWATFRTGMYIEEF